MTEATTAVVVGAALFSRLNDKGLFFRESYVVAWRWRHM